MSTKALETAITAWSEGREPTLGEWDAARSELDAIRKAAKGLNQLDPRKGWNQQAWDDALDLMESIAKDEP